MQEQIDELNETISDLKSEIIDVTDELQDERKLVLEKERYVDDLQDEIRELEDKISNLESELNDVLEKVDNLEDYAAESVYRDVFKIDNNAMTLDDVSRLQLLGELNTKFPTTTLLSKFIKATDGITTTEIIYKTIDDDVFTTIRDLEEEVDELRDDNRYLHIDINRLVYERDELEDKIYQLMKCVNPNFNQLTLDDENRLELLSFLTKKYPTTLLLSEFMGSDLVNEARGVNTPTTIKTNLCDFAGCTCTKVIGNTKEEIRKCAGVSAVNEWVGSDTAGNEYYVVTCMMCNKKSTFLGE